MSSELIPGSDMDLMRDVYMTPKQQAAFDRIKAELTRLRAQVAASGAWQPIETAPRDETYVLLYDPDAIGNKYLHACWHKGFRSWSSPATRSGKSIIWDWEPPYWHPLPQPPQDEKGVAS